MSVQFIRFLRSILMVSILILPLAALGAASQPASDLQARRDALNKLLAEEWEYTLSTSPEVASILGDKRWNDKLSDNSDQAIGRTLRSRKISSRASRPSTPPAFRSRRSSTRR
jgi:hypothetical protein